MIHKLLIFALALAASVPGVRLRSQQVSKPGNLRVSVQPLPPEFFGLHIHHAGDTTAWPQVPFSEWRLWDAYVAWPSLEPQKGKWHFEKLDKYVALAEQHNVGILLPLGLTPQWASARPQEKSTYQPGNAAEPRNIDDWRNYVQTVATRYKGRIHEYEIWNEPNSRSFFTGDVQKMVDLTREASQIIRAIDSDAKIVSPAATTTNGVPWLADFLSKGGGKFVDVIAFHLYVMPKPPEAISLLTLEVQRAMKENGVADKPLWDTETGWAAPKPFPSQLAAAYLVRTELLAWTAGVARLYWYAWDNHNWVSLQMTEGDSQTLTSAGKAYGIAHDWLSGANIAGCSTGSNEIWICSLARNGSRQWIVWSPETTKAFKTDLPVKSIKTLSGDTRILDGEQIQVGPEPILLTALEQ